MVGRVNADQPLRTTARRIVPGAAGGLAALAIAILLARQADAPFLGTILTDASSSVLSTEGFSTFLDLVGQAGNAMCKERGVLADPIRLIPGGEREATTRPVTLGGTCHVNHRTANKRSRDVGAQSRPIRRSWPLVARLDW